MKRWQIFSTASVFFFIGCGVKPNSSAQSLSKGKELNSISILSYNIHHANPPSKPGVIDVSAIANVIDRQQADLVALQEVDVHTARSGKALHEAEEIARLTGMKVFFAKAIN